MTTIDITTLGAADAGVLEAFFRRLSAGDRTFLKNDVTTPGAVERLLGDPAAQHFGVLDGDGLGAYLGAHRLPGWSSHVTELRLVVDPRRRRHGLGTALTRHALGAAVRTGARKLVVEAAAEEQPTLNLFELHGFEPEALLRDQARDAQGRSRDIIVLAHHVEDNRAQLESVGISDAVAGG